MTRCNAWLCLGAAACWVALSACRTGAPGAGLRAAPEAVDSGDRAGTANVTRTIDDVHFTFQGVPDGAEGLIDRATAELLAQYVAGNGNEAALDDAAFELGLALRGAGYPLAEVAYVTGWGDGRRIATLTVAPGPMVVIAGIEVEGGSPLSARALGGYFGQPEQRLIGGRREWLYDRERVQRAPARVAQALASEGYLDATVQLADLDFARVTEPVTLKLAIELGQQHRLGTVELVVAPAAVLGAGAGEVDPEALATCQQAVEAARGPERERPRPFTPRLATELYGALIESLGRVGYPDAVVRVEPTIDASSARVHVRLDVEPGLRVHVGAIRFEGAEKARESFLSHRVETEPGSLSDSAAIRTDVRRLYRTGLFREVRSRLEGVASERDLVFELVERPTREFWVEPGYGSYELLRLGAGVRERNLFGTGRAWRAEGVAALKALRLSTTLTDPWLLGHDLIGDLKLEYDRRDEPSFVRLQRGVGLFVTKEWTQRLTTSVGYQLRRSEVQDVTIVDAGLEDDPDTIDLSTIRITQRVDQRDDVFVPSEGTFVEATLEYGSAALGSELDFLRSTMTLSGYRSLGERDVLAASLRTGLIAPLGGSDSIPLQERFFNGGENSVRSFMESELGPKDRNGEPIGGEAYLTLGAEWRHALTGSLQSALFVDAGQLALDHTDVLNLDDLRSGVGLGLRYLLPIGPLRIDAAVNPDPAAGEDDWAAHFSIGMAF